MQSGQQSNKKHLFETALHLTDIYDVQGDPDDNQITNNYLNIQKRFAKIYGEDPVYFIRVPGSAKLFQTQINSLSMNLAQDIVIAYSKGNDKIIINTTSSVVYPQFTLPLDPQAKIQDEANNLTEKQLKFLKAFSLGYKAAMNNTKQWIGFKCLVSINELPQNIGLGFHSALSLGASMICIHANQINMPKQQLLQNLQILKQQLFQKDLNLELTQIFGSKNSLLLSEKFQIDNKHQQFEFLKKYKFIIVDSLTPEPKMMTYKKRLAKREAEIHLALKFLQKKLNVSQEIKYLFELQKLLGYSDEEMLTFIKQSLSEQSYPIENIEKELEEQLEQSISKIPYSDSMLGSNTKFNLSGQLINYYKEKIRINQAIHILQCQESEQQKALLIGRLMDESFLDTKQLLEVDTPEINLLYQFLKQHQPLGIKLLGVRWGGALIALFPSEKTQLVIRDLQDNYYSDTSRQIMVSDDLSLYVFESSPSIGALYLDPQYEIWF